MQTKLNSFIESCLNVASGFIIALLLWMYVVKPIWNIEVSMQDNFTITIIFTIASVIRSYVWRRLFNNRTERRIVHTPIQQEEGHTHWAYDGYRSHRHDW